MRFAFSDDQLALRDAVHALLERECTPEVVRGAWVADEGTPSPTWEPLAAMGVPGMLVPEARGGVGFGWCELVLVLEEAGRAALPDPLVEHAAVAAPALATVDGRATAAAPDAPLVVGADVADVLVLARDDALWAVPSAATILRRVDAVDGARRLFAIDWSTADATRIGHAADVAAAFDRGALGTAAFLVGLARHLLDVTVDYVSQRRQFGVAVGSFQAVKHQCADTAIALEFAAPLVYRAAHSLAHGDPRAPVDVSMAKAHAGAAAELAARVALQCHGAIGYSYEADLHLWLKRVWALSPAWGDGGWHRARVERAILDGTVEPGGTR